MKRLSILAMAVAIGLSACSSESEAQSTPTSEAPLVAETTTTMAHPEIEESTDSYAEEIEAVFGLVPVETVTPASGGGTRPLLEWVPVDHAYMYSVVLLTPSGKAYWGWEGTETAIHVGGEPQLEGFAAGPSVIEGMTWSVAAYDDEFHVIAVSPRASISP